ncbi:MAG: hypothetical protein ACP5O1_10575 [Phycisphaerae bacterium]
MRIQSRISRLTPDVSGVYPRAYVDITEATFAYGVAENVELIGTVPVVNREIDFPGHGTQSDTGVGDIPILAEWRFYQHDEPGKTTRWAMITGLAIPSFNAPFSSRSFNPIIGTVWTHQERTWEIDLDTVYQDNTGSGVNRVGRWESDAAYTQLLWRGRTPSIGPWGLYGVAELNGNYYTDGSSQVFASPGVEFITPRWILEAGMQLPIYSRIRLPLFETNYTFILGLQFQF